MQIELAKRLLGQRGENSTGRVVVGSSGGGASGVAMASTTNTANFPS